MTGCRRPTSRRSWATGRSSTTATSGGACSVDDLGLAQVRELFADASRMPRLTWWANVVTDAGHHGGGPRSEMARDSLRQRDARLVVFLDHLDGLGVLDDVAFLLTADHGFEGGRPERHRFVAPGPGVPRRPLPRRGPGLRLLPLSAGCVGVDTRANNSAREAAIRHFGFGRQQVITCGEIGGGGPTVVGWPS